MPTMVDMTSSSGHSSTDENSEFPSSTASSTSDTEDLNEGFLKNDETSTINENYSIPRTSELFSSETLKELVSKLQEKDVSSNLLVLKQSLLRYLENRLSRGETVVLREKFCEVLCNNGLPYEQAERFISYFDSENVGEIDISMTLDALRTNFFVSNVDDVTCILKTFEKNHILPGFYDVHCERTSNETNRRRILSYLRRMKLPSTILPYLNDVRYASVKSARSAVVRHWMKNAQLTKFDEEDVDKTVLNVVESSTDKNILTSNSAFKKLEVSSKKSDVHLMTNNETSSYWQSDGKANSHWIRATLKKDVNIWQLFIGVAASDSSYMPQNVVVSVGNHKAQLKEIKENFIPPDFTGDFLLLGRQNKFFRYVEVNVRRCVSDGCDTRVRNFRLEGYRSVTSKEEAVNETCSLWYLNVLTSTVEACLPLAPTLRSSIMQISLECVEKFTPFMLSIDSSSMLTPRILKDVEKFIKIVVFDERCYYDDELKSNGVYVIVNLALACGSLDSILNAFNVLISSTTSKMNVNCAAKLGASLKKTIHTIVAGLCVRLNVDVVESDGDTNLQWKDILDNKLTSRIFRSSVGRRDLHVVFRTSTVILGSIRVRVPSERQNAARRITVYAVRDMTSIRQFFDLKTELIDENMKSKIKIIGRCSYIKGNECEIQLEPCLTPFLIVKFSRDVRSTLTSTSTPTTCIEVNSICFNGFHVNVDESTLEAENFWTDINSTPFTNFDVASLLLNGVNLLLKIQQNVVVDSPYVDIHKGFIFDFKNLRLKTFFDCFTTLFDELRNDDGFNDMRLAFLQIMHLIFNRFSRLIVVELVFDPASGETHRSVDLSGRLFDSLTRLIVDGATQKFVHSVQKIILDGTVIFFPNNFERRAKLLSLLKCDRVGEISSVVFASLCNYFAGRCFASLLDLPTNVDDFESTAFDSMMTIEMMNLLYRKLSDSFLKIKNDKDQRTSPTTLTDIGSLTDLICVQEFYLSSWHYQNLIHNIDLRSLSLLKTSEFCLFSILKLSLRNFLSFLEFNDVDLSIENFNYLRNFLTLFLSTMNDERKTYDVDLILKDLIDIFERLFVLIDEKITSIFLKSIDDEFYLSNYVDESMTLRTWTSVESSHPYDVNCYTQKVFCQFGATEFEITFDKDCFLNKDHYLAFVDHNGVERRFKGAVGSSHWPKSVTIRSLNRLRFVFHSDGGDSKFGYIFDVSAKSPKRLEFHPLADLYVLLARTAGKICSLSLSTNVSDEKTRRFLSSSIWKNIFSKGTSTNDEENSFKIHLKSIINTDETKIRSKLIDEFSKTKLWLGESIERTCFATFAVLIWHVQGLKKEFCNEENFFISNKIRNAFESSANVAQIYLEQRQKKSIDDEDGVKNLENFIDRARFLLEYASMNEENVEKTSKILSEYLLDDSFNVEETENLSCEILFRQELRNSALDFSTAFLKSSSTARFTLRETFLNELFKFDWISNDDDKFFSFVVDESSLNSYCNFVEQLLSSFKSSSANDSKSTSIYNNYLFSTLSVDTPIVVLERFVPDVVRSLLKTIFSKNQTSTKRKIFLNIVDGVDDDSQYKLSVHLLKKCRNDVDHCEQLKNSHFYTYKLFIAQYGDVLNLRNVNVCAGCGEYFGGVRYQCSVCADVTLCLKCFSGGFGPAPHFGDSAAHLMMRFDYKCDQCGGYIAGTRHHCAICDDYDLCDGCFKWAMVADDINVDDSNKKKSPKNNIHEASHEMMTINAERYMQISNAQQLINDYLSNYSWILLIYFVRRLGETSTTTKNFYKNNILKPIISELVIYLQTINNDDDVDESSSIEFDGVETKFFGLLSICGDFCSPIDDVWWYEECFIIILSLLKSGELEKSSIDHLILCLFGRLLTKIDPSVADRSINSTSSTPVVDSDEGYLTVQFLFSFGSTFLLSRDLMWSGTVAKILHKLSLASAQWATTIKNFVKTKLKSIDTNFDDKIFCLLLTTGFPQSIYPGVHVNVVDGGRLQRGVVVASSTGDDDDDLITIVDVRTRYQCKVKSKFVEFVEISLQMNEILNLSELSERCKTSLTAPSIDANMNETESSVDAVSSAFYVKGLCGIFPDDTTSTSKNETNMKFFLSDIDLIRSIVDVASKSTDLPIGTTLKTLEIVVANTLSTETTPMIRRIMDLLQPHVFKEGIKDSIMTCMGQLIADFDVDWYVLWSIYDLKHGGLDATDLMDEVKRIYLNYHDACGFSRSVFYRAALLAQNCSKFKLTPEDLTSTLGSIDVGLRSLDRSENVIDYADADTVDDSTSMDWFEDTGGSRLLRDDDADVDTYANLNNHLLATILIRRFSHDDVETKKKFRQILNAVCDKLTILYARKFLATILLNCSNVSEVFSLVSDVESTKGDVLSALLCLINLFYVTEDVKSACKNVLKNVYELLPPNPEYVNILCRFACQFLRESINEKCVNYLDSKICKIDVEMKYSSAFTMRFFGGIGGTFKGLLIVEYGDVTKTVRSDDKYLSKKLFIPSNRCSVEWKHDEENNLENDDYMAWIRLEFDGVETPGRFEIGYDLMNLILDDEQIHDDVPWSDVWMSASFVTLSSPVKYRLKMLTLLTKIGQVFNVDAWKYREISLKINRLSRFWNNLQTSEKNSTTNTNKILLSEEARTSALLFYTLENITLQRNSTSEYVETTSICNPCLKVYAQAVGVVASLSAAIGVENKSTELITNFYIKKKSSVDENCQFASFLGQETQSKRRRSSLDLI